MEKKKEWIENIIVFLIIANFLCWLISFLVAILWPGGWCINSETIENLYLYREQAQIINNNTLGKIYPSEENLVLQIKNIIDKDFYEENIYGFSLSNIEEIDFKKEEVYFKPLYIPSEIEIEGLKAYKNKTFETIVDFDMMLNSLELEDNFKSLVNHYKDNEPDIKRKATFFMFFLLGTFLILIFVLAIFFPSKKKNEEHQEEIKKEEKEQPDKIKPTWEYGKVELMEQLEVTKKHIRIIFLCSLIAIIVGLFLIFKIIVTEDIGRDISILGIIGGVIAEFIGATLLLMYKSLISQLNENLKILERLNFVGIGIKILDTIESDDKKEVNSAKMKLAQQIIDKIQQSKEKD